MYTVKHAAALTGISPDTLRIWERRYGVVAPVRTDSGYRMYDDAAISRLTAMQALVAAGWSPRRAAEQVSSGTTLGPLSSDDPAPVPPGQATGPDVDLLVELAAAFDPVALGRRLDEVFASMALEDLADAWLMPALQRLGAAWHGGKVSVAGEHFVSAGVQRRLATALDQVAVPDGAPRVMVGLVRGSRHELGVLAFSVLLALNGLDVAYLGADLPPDSWVVAVTGAPPDAVVIGVPTFEDVPSARDAVAAISAARPGLPVLLGGAHQHRVGAGEQLGHRLAEAAAALAGRLAHHA